MGPKRAARVNPSGGGARAVTGNFAAARRRRHRRAGARAAAVFSPPPSRGEVGRGVPRRRAGGRRRVIPPGPPSRGEKRGWGGAAGGRRVNPPPDLPPSGGEERRRDLQVRFALHTDREGGPAPARGWAAAGHPPGPPSRGEKRGRGGAAGGRGSTPLPTSPLPGGRSADGIFKCDCPAFEPEAPFSNRFPAPGRGNGRRARASPLFAGLSRSIPVYLGLSRFIPVDSGLSWSVPVYSGPSRPVPVAAGRKRMRSAERRVKGAARTAAPCRERRRVRRSPTPFGPRAVDGVHAPVDSIRSPPGQPRSSRAPGRPHLEISGRLAGAAIAGRGARGRRLLSSPLSGGRSGGRSQAVHG